jgi:hypothetical protein
LKHVKHKVGGRLAEERHWGITQDLIYDVFHRVSAVRNSVLFPAPRDVRMQLYQDLKGWEMEDLLVRSGWGSGGYFAIYF